MFEKEVPHFSIPNLKKYQHYKNRNPPWIKLHSLILEDYKLSCLQDASKLHLILIWVLASRMNNRVPFDPVWVKNKIGAKTDVDLKLLLDKGFIECDIEMLASCKQNGEPERERERETEKKKSNTQKKKSNPEKDTFILPEDFPPEEWDDWMKVRKGKKASNSDRAKTILVRKIREIVYENPEWTIKQIIETALTRGWIGIEKSWIIKLGGKNVGTNRPRSLTFAEIDAENQSQAIRQFLSIGEDTTDQIADNPIILDCREEDSD